jgi:hypothetical protein
LGVQQIIKGEAYKVKTKICVQTMQTLIRTTRSKSKSWGERWQPFEKKTTRWAFHVLFCKYPLSLIQCTGTALSSSPPEHSHHSDAAPAIHPARLPGHPARLPRPPPRSPSVVSLESPPVGTGVSLGSPRVPAWCPWSHHPPPVYRALLRRGVTARGSSTGHLCCAAALFDTELS